MTHNDNDCYRLFYTYTRTHGTVIANIGERFSLLPK